MVSTREPLTACSVGSDHSPSVALLSGLKLPPVRSASMTARTEGGSEESTSPLTTAPGSDPSSLTYSVLFWRAVIERLDQLRHAARLRQARFALFGGVEPLRRRPP